MSAGFLESENAFPFKVYGLLEDASAEGFDTIVSWIQNGTSFMIHDREKFVRYVLPRFFHHRTFKSFQRQLSFYKFARTPRGPYKGAYSHRYFVRGMRKMCHLVTRPSKLMVEEQKTGGSAKRTPPSHTTTRMTTQQHHHRGDKNDSRRNKNGNGLGSLPSSPTMKVLGTDEPVRVPLEEDEEVEVGRSTPSTTSSSSTTTSYSSVERGGYSNEMGTPPLLSRATLEDPNRFGLAALKNTEAFLPTTTMMIPKVVLLSSDDEEEHGSSTTTGRRQAEEEPAAFPSTIIPCHAHVEQRASNMIPTWVQEHERDLTEYACRIVTDYTFWGN